MMIRIPYGTQELVAPLDWADVIDTLTIGEAPPLPDLEETFRGKLDHPIACAALRGIAKPGASVLIIVSDSFRKTAVHLLLPALIQYLNEAGIQDEQIAFLFSTGTHRAPSPEEQAEILGQAIYARFHARAYSHDPDDESNLVHLGTTSRRTPVFINRRAIEADIVIATGTTVLHYFGGFGGGRKSIVPGIAGRKTIAANHALNLDPVENRLNPDVAIGRLEGNPVAEDMLEASLLTTVDFIINTVLNRDGEIADVFCGAMTEAHRAACTYAHSLYAIPFRARADFAIVSAGNAKNFIQSHKSLYNAFQVVKPGGFLILATPAAEGYGGNKFEEWIRLGSTEAIISALRCNAEINGQTALSTLEKAHNAVFITEMCANEVRQLGAVKAIDLADALARVRDFLDFSNRRRPTCYVLPEGAYTVPVLRP